MRVGRGPHRGGTLAKAGPTYPSHPEADTEWGIAGRGLTDPPPRPAEGDRWGRYFGAAASLVATTVILILIDPWWAMIAAPMPAVLIAGVARLLDREESPLVLGAATGTMGALPVGIWVSTHVGETTTASALVVIVAWMSVFVTITWPLAAGATWAAGLRSGSTGGSLSRSRSDWESPR